MPIIQKFSKDQLRDFVQKTYEQAIKDKLNDLKAKMPQQSFKDFCQNNNVPPDVIDATIKNFVSTSNYSVYKDLLPQDKLEKIKQFFQDKSKGSPTDPNIIDDIAKEYLEVVNKLTVAELVEAEAALKHGAEDSLYVNGMERNDLAKDLCVMLRNKLGKDEVGPLKDCNAYAKISEVGSSYTFIHQLLDYMPDVATCAPDIPVPLLNLERAFAGDEESLQNKLNEYLDRQHQNKLKG